MTERNDHEPESPAPDATDDPSRADQPLTPPDDDARADQPARPAPDATDDPSRADQPARPAPDATRADQPLTPPDDATPADRPIPPAPAPTVAAAPPPSARIEEGAPRAPLDARTSASQRYGRRLVAFASGKGGVGKSMLCANLGIFLAQIGKRVVLLDGNLGCANLHAILGAEHHSRTLGDYLDKRSPRLEDVVVATPVSGLGLISGARDPAGVAHPEGWQVEQLGYQLKELPADYVLVDLSPGVGNTVLDLFLLADVSVVVTVPEPGSVETTFRFLKSAYMRKLHDIPESERVVAHARREWGIPAPLDLYEFAEVLDPELGATLRAAAVSLRPYLIVNQTRTRDESELGLAMRSAARRRLGLSLELLGHLEYDEAARVAIRRGRPLAVEYADTKVAKNLERVARKLLSLEGGDSLRHSAVTEPPQHWEQQHYFDILEVDPGASDEEIRHAHRRAKETFANESLVVRGLFGREELTTLGRRVEEAYDTLIAPDRRRRYELEVFPDGHPPRTPTPVSGLPPPPLTEPAPASAPPAVPPPDIGPDTVFSGPFLRKVRESHGIALADISQRTKIGVPHLRNLEEERFAEMPAQVYVRGFLAEYARYLRLDAKQVLASYMERYREALDHD